MKISLDKQDKMHYINISNHYKRSNETGTKVSDHIKSKKRKGEYHYEEMGLYSMRLCL